MTVKVTIVGEGLSFERETPLFNASQIIAFLSQNDNTIQNTEVQSSYKEGSMLASQSTILNKKTTPREALIKSGARTNPEKIATLGEFLRNQNRTSTFSPTEIKLALKRAGEPMPQNFSRDVNVAVSSGLICEDDIEKGQYFITDAGKEAINSEFKIIPTKKPQIPKRTNKSTQVKIREEIRGIEISTSQENIPDYFTFKTKVSRILWLLTFAVEKNLEYLTPSEIEYLADRLRDSIPSKAITSLTSTSISNGYIVKTNEGFKIIQKGIAELKKNTAPQTP